VTPYEFHHVDVFTETPYEGNPLAVVLTPDELPTATMQRIANEFNLAETVFIRQTTDAAMPLRLRIFTPLTEMPFAGHPTIGAAFVAHREGMLDETSFAFEENVGPVPVTIDETAGFRAWLTTPPVTLGTRVDLTTATAAVGLTIADARSDAPPQVASAGAPFLYLAVRDEATVDRASRDDALAIRGICRTAGAQGFYVFAVRDGGVYSRMFGPELGIVEDPATGGATGPLAAYALEYALLPDADRTAFTAEQGTLMGRRSFLHVRIAGAAAGRTIEVGGSAVHIMEGTISV
jgi:trans-2,3-dihydro-3-hydroxyanthranilate isomerase